MIVLKKHNERPYRQLEYMMAGHKKAAYISATGTGKSYVVGKYIEQHGLEDKTLILVPLNAISGEWRKMFPNIRIETYQGVTSKIAKDKHPYENVKLVVCDELHHLGAEVWGESFREMFKEFDCKFIGLSATPVRYLDNARDMVAEEFDGNRIDGYSLPEAINMGILPTFRYVTAMYNFPEKVSQLKIKIKNKGKLTPELKKRLALEESKESLEDILKKEIHEKHKKIIVFCDCIENVGNISTMFEKFFPDANHCIMHTQQTDLTNTEQLKKFKNGEGQSFLYVVDMLSEGVHMNGVDVVVMMRKTRSPIVYLQQLGRGLTADNADKRILICDLVANHISIEDYNTVNEQTIGIIQSEITEEKRQIIVEDYAIKQYEILKKLEELLINPWTPEEVQILKEHANDENAVEEIQKLIPNKTKKSIQQKLKSLGLYNYSYTYYSPEEDEIIRNNFVEFNDYKKVQKLIKEKTGKDRNEKSIKTRARALGVGERKIKTSWSEEDVELMKQYFAKNGYSNDTVSELSKLLNKSEKSIRLKATRVGCTPSKKFTEEEKRIVLEHWQEGMGTLRKLIPNRTTNSICKIAKKVGVKIRQDEWKPEELEVVMKYYETKGSQYCVEEIARIGYKRSRNSVRNKAQQLGIIVHDSRAWTKEEEEELIRLYPTMTLEALAKHFHRDDPRYVSKKAKKLGLSKRNQKKNSI